MGSAGCIIRALEEDKITGLGFAWRNDSADLTQAFRAESSDVPAISAMIDDPGNEARAVKARGRGRAAPDIRIAQVFLGLCDHSAESLVRKRLTRDVVVENVLHGDGIGVVTEDVRPVAQCLHKEGIPGYLIVSQASRKQDFREAVVLHVDVQDIVLIGHFDLVFFLFVIRFPGLRIGISDRSGPSLRPVPGLHDLFDCQLILCIKDLLQRALDLSPGKILKHDCQIRRQFIRIMTDLLLRDVVLVIAGILRPNVVDPGLKRILQCTVVGLSAKDVGIFSGIRGVDDHVGTALEHHRTGANRSSDQHDHNKNPSADQQTMPVLGNEFRNLFRGFLCFLCGFTRAFRRCRSS